MNFELSEKQRAFQQTARDFSIGELAPHAAMLDAEAIFLDKRDCQLGHCGGEASLAREIGEWTKARLVLPERTGRRFRCRVLVN